MLELVIIIGLFNTTLLICLKKWKWLEWYSVRRPLWLPAADCYLCMGFWLALFQCISLFIMQGNLDVFIAPLCSAAVTNYLTNIAVLHDYNKGRK